MLWACITPAMKFIDIANRFVSDIQVSNEQSTADGKSIMEMGTLAAIYGTHLTIRAQGPDAEQAVDALRELVEVRMFDEPPRRTRHKRQPERGYGDKERNCGFAGVSIGKCLILDSEDYRIPRRTIEPAQRMAEIQRVRNAFREAVRELTALEQAQEQEPAGAGTSRISLRFICACCATGACDARSRT